MALPRPSTSTTCLVTGASSGIGEQLARGLARRGHNLTLVARREGRLNALAEELARTTGVETHAIACDLSAADARRRLVQQVQAAGRDVSVLVNGAGFGSGGHFADLDGEAELRMARVNVEAVVDLCSVYGAPMVRRGEGAVLNIASVAGFAPIPRQATYAATKAFVISFSDALHADWHSAGVTVTTLCPGPDDHGVRGGQRAARRRRAAQAAARGDLAARHVAEAGLRALERGQRQRTVGVLNKASAIAAALLPRGLELSVMDRFYPVRG